MEKRGVGFGASGHIRKLVLGSTEFAIVFLDLTRLNVVLYVTLAEPAL